MVNTYIMLEDGKVEIIITINVNFVSISHTSLFSFLNNTINWLVIMKGVKSLNVTTSMSIPNDENELWTLADNPNKWNNGNNNISKNINDTWSMPSFTHDFTDCCRSLNVSHKCMRYCTVYMVFNRSNNYPDANDLCVEDYVNIVKCSSGGRNHVQCCQKKNIPEMCQVNRIMLLIFLRNGCVSILFLQKQKKTKYFTLFPLIL